MNDVRAYLEFDVRGEVVTVPLPHAPAGALNSLQPAIAQVSSGQRLWRYI